MAWLLLLPSVAVAETFVVAPNGSDANPGTLALPWKTVQHAANVATPGSVVEVRAGIYKELVQVGVSGNATAGPITYRSMPGELAIFDGTGVTVPNADTGFFFVNGRDWISIEGFEFRNLTTSTAARTPIAIHVRGAAEHITLRDNLIHDIATTNANGNAHGIAIYADATAPCTDLLVEGNEIRNCKLGSSEAMAINGNVDGFAILDNWVHDCDNIGIVMIGGEGTAPQPSLDRARNGLVERNLVHGIDSLSNPAYAGERSADGIYVDGGCCIEIDRNTIHHANLGIELASEHEGLFTEEVVATNNVVHDCHVAGISLGGYDTTVGGTRGVTLVNNTCYRNDSDATGSGELMLQDDVAECVIRNNILSATPQAVVISNPFTHTANVLFESNQYWVQGGPAAASFALNNIEYGSFAAWKAATGQDTLSGYAAPSFAVVGAVPDLHLKPGSPCINAGVNGFVPLTAMLDRDGLLRVAQGVVDRGAYEFASSAPAAADLTLDGVVDAADLAALLGSWGACVGCAADLNHDGMVGSDDLAVLLGAWSGG